MSIKVTSTAICERCGLTVVSEGERYSEPVGWARISVARRKKGDDFFDHYPPPLATICPSCAVKVEAFVKPTAPESPVAQETTTHVNVPIVVNAKAIRAARRHAEVLGREWTEAQHYLITWLDDVASRPIDITRNAQAERFKTQRLWVKYHTDAGHAEQDAAKCSDALCQRAREAMGT